MTTKQTITFQVPLPPKELRGNSRAHWAAKKKAADEYSNEVYWRYIDRNGNTYGEAIATVQGHWRSGHPWQRAHVTYTWRYCGVKPDHSNLGGNTKYLQDIIAVAPKLSPEQAEKYKRYHLGIVENDSGIEAVFKAEKVSRRKDECVVVEISRLEEE